MSSLRDRRRNRRRPVDTTGVRWMVPATGPTTAPPDPAGAPAEGAGDEPGATFLPVDGPWPGPASNGAEGPSEDSSRDQVKARLAARGLVRTGPSVRIRELAPPDPKPALPAEEAGSSAEAVRVRWAEAVPEGDRDRPAADDPEPDPGGPRAAERCASCGDTAEVAVDATRFTCPTCNRAWRWAECGSCDKLALTVAQQESWRCSGCGEYTRSWWRTSGAAADSTRIRARRGQELAQRERAVQEASARRRRRRLVAGGSVVIALAALSAVLVQAAGSGSAQARTKAACARYERLTSQVSNGAVSKQSLAQELAALKVEAVDGTPGVATAGRRLAAAGRPGTADFLIASTEMADACRQAGA